MKKKSASKNDGQQTGYKVAESVISRRNQNGTIVLMKTLDAVSFYKVDGIAAEVWRCFATPQTSESVIDHLSKLHPKHAKLISRETGAMIQKLLRFDLLAPSKGPYGVVFPTPIPSAPKLTAFGTLQKFDLAQIESEVLNDSLYLDVFAGSDLRLKSNVAPIQDALSKVLLLNGITHTWKKNVPVSNPKTRRAGLIAQQVATQMPELVREDQSTGVLAVDYQKLNSYLVESIKDLNKIILKQDARIRKLEAKAE